MRFIKKLGDAGQCKVGVSVGIPMSGEMFGR